MIAIAGIILNVATLICFGVGNYLFWTGQGELVDIWWITAGWIFLITLIALRFAWATP